MQIGGAPLEKARSHTVRTAAFLAGGAGGCGGLAAAEHSLDEEGGPPLFGVRQARLVAEGAVSPAEDGRVVERSLSGFWFMKEL